MTDQPDANTLANEEGLAEGSAERPPVPIETQQTMVKEFVDGLLRCYGIDAECVLLGKDEESFEIDIQGDNLALGLLIGPRGRHVSALHEVAKTMLQRQLTAKERARLKVDVGGYRNRRAEALRRYVLDLAEGVRETGVERVLEPMGASDRKIVHDAMNEIEGVATSSVGEEPRRSVVIKAAVQQD